MTIRNRHSFLIAFLFMLAVFMNGCMNQSTEHLDNLTYRDGFAEITYGDLGWMQEASVSLDVYVKGSIREISPYNMLVIEDADGAYWSVDVGTENDLSGYLGSVCEVFGFSTGRISTQLGTPVINLDHDGHHVMFADGTALYPAVCNSEK